METDKITGESIERYLRKGKRFDGRSLNEFREIKITTGVSKKAEGSARVKIGKTEVIAGIKMDISEPYPDSPNKGNLMTTVELLPLSSPRFESGPPRFPAIELGRIIDRAIRESKVIELDKLCIKEGEKVWTVFVDLYSLNDDGNLLDALGIAAIAALKDAKIPKYDEEKEIVLHEELSDKKIPLSKDIPLSITMYKIGDYFVVDPTREEEDISLARVTIGSHEGIIYSLQKGEEGELTIEEFSNIIDNIINIEKELYKKLKL